jgi:hypothetical protein
VKPTVWSHSEPDVLFARFCGLTLGLQALVRRV